MDSGEGRSHYRAVTHQFRYSKRTHLPRGLRLTGLLASVAIFQTAATPLLDRHDTMPGAAYADEVPPEEIAAVRQDVDAICELVRTEYVYFPEREAGWGEACDLARAEADTEAATSPTGHIRVLERLLDELWDNHVSMGANSAVSPRLVPSGSDYWLDWRGGKAVVSAVRPGSGAAMAGLDVGDVVRELNGVPVLPAAMARIRSDRNRISETRLEWALNAQAAGYRGDPRIAKITRNNRDLELDLGEPQPVAADRLVTSRVLAGDVGYIRFEDSLGNSDTVAAFDEALEQLGKRRRWVIDLRNTPGGGNTGVAEPILARFIRGVKTYQRSGPRWDGEAKRRVASRGPWRVKGRVAVLAGRWTGSMGEGLAVGFDGLNRGRVFGSSMAGLAGGVESFELPGSGWHVRLPAYDLRHVDGTPRHDWHPPVRVIADNGDGPDRALDAALDWLD